MCVEGSVASRHTGFIRVYQIHGILLLFIAWILLILLLNIDVSNEEMGQIFYCEQDNQISDDKNKSAIMIAVATSAAVTLIVIVIILILVIICCWRRYKLQSMHVAIQLARCLCYLFPNTVQLSK